jgi:hypothetical protein
MIARRTVPEAFGGLSRDVTYHTVETGVGLATPPGSTTVSMFHHLARHGNTLPTAAIRAMSPYIRYAEDQEKISTVLKNRIVPTGYAIESGP